MNTRTVIVPGKVVAALSLATAQGSVAVRQAGEGEVAVECGGLVVALCGGGNVLPEDPVWNEAVELARSVAERGGIVVNGGENGGLMLASSQAAPENCFGVACPYHELHAYGPKAVVASYHTRKMIICAAPVVVVFPGQVGTFDELVTSIGWLKSLQKQGLGAAVLWVHDYWRDVAELLHAKGALQENVWQGIRFFSESHDINFG